MSCIKCNFDVYFVQFPVPVPGNRWERERERSVDFAQKMADFCRSRFWE